jgi:hypothetical protein
MDFIELFGGAGRFTNGSIATRGIFEHCANAAPNSCNGNVKHLTNVLGWVVMYVVN